MSEWQEKRRKRFLLVSASQFSTFGLCERKWWLNKVRKMPAPPRTAHIFGTVLAQVCERYLLADDLGYANGQPVDLYPPGWTIALNKFDADKPDGEISVAEADRIQRLVAKAIEEGVLERRPHRKPEHEFRFCMLVLGCQLCRGSRYVYDENNVVLECPACKGTGEGTNITIVGAMDVFYPESVEDHKSVKKMKYARSAKKLKTDTQMLVYAKVALEAAKAEGRPLPEQLTLRHNVYCKDDSDPRVRKVEVTVTRREIEAHWDRMLYASQRMEFWRQNANTWSDLPEPPTGVQACNAYGGCEFRTICSGRESEQGYETRVDNYLAASNNGPVPLTVNGEQTMSTFASNLATSQAAAGAAPPPAAPPAAVNPPPLPQPVAPVAPQAPQPAPQPVAVPAPVPVAAPQPAAVAPTPIALLTPAAPVAPQPMATGSPVVPVAPTIHAPAPIAPEPAYPAVHPVAPVVPAQLVAPPWTNPSDVACGGFGFNTKGQPCPICTESARQSNQPTPDLFNLTFPGDGTCLWSHKTIPNYTGSSPLPQGAVPTQADERVATPVATTDPTPQPTVTETPAPKTNSKGRKHKSFVLLVNCGPIRGSEARGDRKVHDLVQTMAQYGQQCAQSYGMASFYDLDPVQRRDVLARAAPAMAEQFDKGMVMAYGVTQEQSDIKALVDALCPLAGMVIVSVGQIGPGLPTNVCPA